MVVRVLLAALLVVQGFAQKQPGPATPPSSQEPKPIRVQVNEVIVPVTVTDEKGRFVSDLDQADFQIYDEGKLQNIRYFSRERSQPVVVGFLLDLSNSNRSNWPKFQEAAAELALTLLPGDKKYSGYLIGYGADAELLVNTTSDPEKIVEKIRKMRPGGGAALYDAIYQACTSRTVVAGEPLDPRRVVVVVGDGNDNSSKHSLEEVLEIAQRNLVTIYGVSTMAYGFANEGDKNLVRLAEETGGRVEYPLQEVYKDVAGYLSQPRDEGNYALQPGTGGYAAAIAKSIFNAISNVAGEVTTQYIIRYIPDDNGNTKIRRNIEVKVALANVKVRARKHYYPNAP
ncbi:MAG TPA: VWA domain-containing protein [Bryobacteraceae bacterium]|jgi:VWFA-related protein|nr:VWA domain-containing protein [Bryobacteraceae bacterium]